jgi:hypothetical protein
MESLVSLFANTRRWIPRALTSISLLLHVTTHSPFRFVLRKSYGSPEDVLILGILDGPFVYSVVRGVLRLRGGLYAIVSP